MIDPIKFLVSAVPIILAITLHEAAHGYVALLCGDDTAKRMGRLTLNPLKHIDPFGSIVLPGILFLAGSPFLFGYAKPVPVNFLRLHNPRWDSVYVAAAGPLMNIFLAFVSAFLLRFAYTGPEALKEALVLSLTFNVVLALFNMLPIPPLDGWRVLTSFLPSSLARLSFRLEPYGLLIVFVVLIVLPFFGFSLFSTLLHPLMIKVVENMAYLVGL